MLRTVMVVWSILLAVGGPALGAAPSPVMNREAALDDAALFFRTVEDAHPDPLHRLTDVQYRRMRSATRDAVTLAADRNGLVRRAALAAVLARAAAAFGDGATALVLDAGVLTPADLAATFPPFVLRLELGRPVIVAGGGALEGLEGGVVTAVDGTSFERWFSGFVARSSGDTDAARLSGALERQILMWNLTPVWKRPEVVVSVDRSGTVVHPSVRGLGSEDFRRLLARAAQRLAPPPPVALMGAGRVLVARFMGLPSDVSVARAAVSAFSGQRPVALLLDLRGAGGDDTSALLSLVGRTSARPLRLAAREYLKPSPLVPVASLPPGGISSGPFLVLEHSATPVGAGDLAPVLLLALTGPGTRNGGAAVAAALHDFAVGTVIGEPTGATRERFGGLVEATLPNSGLRFTVATRRILAPLPGKGDVAEPVRPDLMATAAGLALWREAADPMLAWAVNVASGR